MQTQTATEIKERPILFSSAMVKAILNGSKTQTRRVVKPQINVAVTPNGQPDCWYWFKTQKKEVTDYTPDRRNLIENCPYGKIGDLLWVRETWQDADWLASNGEIIKGYFYKAAHEEDSSFRVKKWKPSIHMPRAASRITLEITNIKVEKLQDVSESDAKAEGVGALAEKYDAIELRDIPLAKHQLLFANLWDEINAKRGFSFESNPFVWVIEFKKV